MNEPFDWWLFIFIIINWLSGVEFGRCIEQRRQDKKKEADQ